MSETNDLALRIAEALRDEFNIGEFSHFCDELDFDHASADEIAKIIRPFISE